MFDSLLEIIGGALIAGVATYFLIDYLSERDLKKKAKEANSSAQKIKITKKQFHDGAYNINADIWGTNSKLDTMEVKAKDCDSSIYVGKEIYI